MRKMAVLEIHPRIFREILQLPEGAEVVDMRVAIDRRGVLELKIVGAGFDTNEGGIIQRVTGTVTKNAGGWPFIDWGLPSNAELRGDAPPYGAASLSTDGLGNGG